MSQDGIGDSGKEAVPVFSGGALRDDVVGFRRALEEWGWGRRPWHRLKFMVGAVVPSLLVLRVCSVAHWRIDDSWLIVTHLGLGNWLHVVVGSFYGWLPYSGYVVAFSMVFFIPSSCRFFYASSRAERERGRRFLIHTVDDMGALLLLFVPFILVAVIGIAYVAVRDLDGVVVAGGTLFTGLLLGWLKNKSDGVSAVALWKFALEAGYPELPVVDSSYRVDNLVSATAYSPIPYVLIRSDNISGYRYIDTFELSMQIALEQVKLSDEIGSAGRRVPLLPNYRLMSEVAEEYETENSANVLAVRVGGKIRIVYAWDGAASVEDNSNFRHLSDAILLALSCVVLFVVIAAAVSSTPWVSHQCLKIGESAPARGYVLVDGEGEQIVRTDSVHSVADMKTVPMQECPQESVSDK
ncbi:Uncharacterised protein [Mycobacteroides abscessus subsp. massiliense]|uniref:hypothetical protein n=1 Tax=Mycobacteroides abscessus TaxID=36809 RepID=UPI0009D3E071|nr:hypothetical protein [Mycobacteroides abscessus]SLI45178.1 Uncharacterised protein [Mycobacteroides abscessus subsp. massiliense]